MTTSIFSCAIDVEMNAKYVHRQEKHWESTSAINHVVRIVGFDSYFALHSLAVRLPTLSIDPADSVNSANEKCLICVRIYAVPKHNIP